VIRSRISGRRQALLLAVTATFAGVSGSIWPADASSPRGPSTVNVSVERRVVGRPIQAGFLGLSIEYWATEAYAGKDPRAINPVLARLIQNVLSPRAGVLRIGGVSTDKTWWPVKGFRQPLGVNYKLNRRRLAVIKSLASTLGARLIMGINLEANSPIIAAAEVHAMLSQLGRRQVEAFELGNEPELYGNRNFGWYFNEGHAVTGRSPNYDLAAFTQDFSRMSSALPGAPLAGPSSGARRWLDHLGEFIAAQPRLRLVTVHRYPLQACYNTPAAPNYPTIGRLLSPVASRAVAGGVVPYLAVAHRLHLLLRIDEMNNVSCGNPAGVADTFAMALWVIDALFADAQAGVDGVNIHTYPGAIYQLFKFTRRSSTWQALVEPEYYGLLMFSKATPPGATLLQTSGGSDAVRIWATHDREGNTRVVLINDDLARNHVVAVGVAGARGAATVERLQAPSARARSGITFAGQSYGTSTDTGSLSGRGATNVVKATAHGYIVRLPSASAALLTLR
jgi:Glycosyl hydrolase family 79 C-terminal beta domain